MSYKNKKKRKSKINKLKFFIGLFLIKLFNKLTKGGKEKEMKVDNLQRVMDFLRQRNRIIRPNNLKISEWAFQYLRKCLFEGKPVNILTQWCLSKALEKRMQKQKGKFLPTKKERRILEVEIPELISVFLTNGLGINWWITFNRSYLESRLVSKDLENQYKALIASLSQNPALKTNVLFLDWEDDVLYGRPKPAKEILADFDCFVDPGVFQTELQRWLKWSEEEAGLDQSREALQQDVKYQIACEANEGRLLMSDKSPFGQEEFIIVPLEFPERFDNFTIFAKDIKKRIVAVLSFYPWRMKLTD